MRSNRGINIFLKVIMWIFIILLFLVLSLIIIFPKFVSTEKGREFTLKIINRHIEGQLSIEKIDLNWFSGQYINNFLLTDYEGKEVLSFNSFSTGENLFSAMIGRFHIGETILMNPHLFLDENKEGELNIKKIVKSKKKKPSEKKSSFRPPRFFGSISIRNGEIRLSSAKVIVPVSLNNINFEAKDAFSHFRIEAKTSQGTNEGALLAYGQCCKNIQIVACVNNFPISFIDQLNESKIYEAALGSSLNLDLELTKKENDLFIETKITTPNLKGNFKGITKNEVFILEQGNILFSVTPTFFKSFFDSKEWHLANRPELILDIEKLILPLELKRPNFRLIPFLGKMTLERAELTHADLGILSINNFKADFATSDQIDISYSALVQGKGEPTQLGGNIQIFSDKKVTFNTSFVSLPTDVLELVLSADLPYLHKILGEQFTLNLNGKYFKGLDLDLSLSTEKFDIGGKVKGETLKNLKADMDGILIFPVRYRSFVGNTPPKIHLEADFSFHDRTLTIPNLDIDIDNENFTLNIRGHVGEKGRPFDYKDVSILGDGIVMHLPISANNLDYHGRFSFKFDGNQNLIRADTILNALSNSNESIVIDFEAKDVVSDNLLNIESGTIELLAKVREFPVIFFDTFFGKNLPLPYLVGPHIDFDAHVQKPQGKEEMFNGNLSIKGEGFLLNLNLLIDGGLNLNQNKPAILQWELTPERYAYLLQYFEPERHVDYLLQQSALIDLVVEKFSCPKLPITNIQKFVCDGGLTGHLKITPLLFINPTTSETFSIKNIETFFSSNNVSKKISINLFSEIDSQYTPPNSKSSFSFNIDTLDLLTEQGALNSQDFTVNGEINLEYIPVGAMVGVLPLKTKTKETLHALLGPLINARIYGNISKLAGPLTIDVKASNFKGIFPLYFTTESLTLQKNVEAEVTLTEELNEILLKDITPLFISGAWSDHPLKLFIEAPGFYVHLKPFAFKDIVVDRAVLDLGKVRVKNGGQILSLMKFLKAKEVSSEGVMEAWFTPIFINLKGGVASYKRFDAMLAGNVHIAMWGRIDILNDNVGMTLGISPVTLQKSYDVMKMSNKDMFQVKMRGSTSNLDLDWSSAYTRIGIILTRTAGGHIGYIVGGILEQLVGLLGEEKTPDPTTSPFPWEKRSKNIPQEEGMPQEVSWKEEPTAGLRKILNFLIP